MPHPRQTRNWIIALAAGLWLCGGQGFHPEPGASLLPCLAARAAPAPAQGQARRAPSGAQLGAWEDRELRRLRAELRRLERSPLGVEPVLALGSLQPRLPRGALGATLASALGRRTHPLVGDALRWLALGEALRRDDKPEAARHREALGLIADTWWVLGPMDNEGGAGLRRLQQPEHTPEAPLWEGKTYVGKQAPEVWRRLPPLFPDGVLRPGELLEEAHTSVVLLRTDVEARRPMVAALRLGTSGGYRVWHNGKLVAERDVRRPLRLDQDAVGIHLSQGRNAILLVLGTEANPPEVVLRLTAPNGGPLPGWVASRDTLAPRRGGAARPGRPARGLVWPTEPLRGKGGSEVAVLGPRPKPVPGPRVLTARQALEEEVKRRPKAAEPLTALARFHLSVSPEDPRQEQALAAARAALALAPTAETQLTLAISHSQTDARRLALADLLKADPKEVRALSALAEHYYGAWQHHRAEELWRRALDADPGYVIAALRLAELAQVRRMPSLALAELRQLAARHPTRPDVLEALAALEVDLGFGDTAAKRLEDLVRTQRTNLALLHRLASLARQRLDLKGSQRWLREIIEVRPDWLRPREELAESLAAGGEPEAGVRVLREALALAPRSHHLHVTLGRIALRGGLFQVALGALAGALEIRPQDLATKQLLAYLERQGPDPLVTRWAVDGLALARKARAQKGSREDAEVLHHVLAYSVLPSGLSRRFQQQVILVHNLQGVEAWHTHHLDYLPDTQHLEVRVARVIRPDGTETEASQSDVPLGDPALRMYYDRRLKVLRFRGLQPGDCLEIQTLLSDIPASNLFKDYFGAIQGLQTRAPVRRLHVAIQLPPGRTLQANKPALAGLVHRVTRNASGSLHTWDAKDVPGVQDEPLGPGWAEQQAYLHVSTFATWPEVARWYWDLIKEQYHADDAIRAAAKEATREARTVRDKVIAIYHLVVKRTRYVALAFGMHTYKPYSAPEVFGRKFGDCKDKAMLMAVLLGELGIDSHPVLVRTRRGGDLADLPPSLAVFDHAILYVPALKLYLDGTAERTGSSELPAANQGVTALIIDGKDGLRVRTPVLASHENHTDRKLDILIAADGSAEVVDNVRVKGQDAPWWRRSFTDPATRNRTYEKMIAPVFPGAAVKEVLISDPDALEQPVTLRARYRVPRFARLAGERVSADLTIAQAPLTQQLAPLASRTQPTEYAFPFEQSVSISVRWPKGWHLVSAPEALSRRELGAAGSHALEGSQKVTAQPDRLTVIRALKVRRHRFSAASYGALRRFFVAMDGAMRRPMELRRTQEPGDAGGAS